LILPYNFFKKTINKNNLKQIVFYKNALYPQKQTGVQRFFLGHGLLHMNRLACPTWMMGRSAVILIQLIPVQKCYLGPTMKSQYYKLYSESTSSPLLQRGIKLFAVEAPHSIPNSLRKERLKERAPSLLD